MPLVISLSYYVISKESILKLLGKKQHFATVLVVIIFGVTVSAFLRLLYTGNLKDAGKFFGVSAVSVFSFLASSLFVASVVVRGLPELDAYVTLFLMLAFNCIIIHYPSSPRARRFGLPLLYLVGFSSVAMFVWMSQPTLIPRAVMSLYKLGDFKASLVLDKKGCVIAQERKTDGVEIVQQSDNCVLLI